MEKIGWDKPGKTFIKQARTDLSMLLFKDVIKDSGIFLKKFWKGIIRSAQSLHEL